MLSYFYYYLGYEDEIDADVYQTHLKHVLNKEIREYKRKKPRLFIRIPPLDYSKFLLKK